MPQPYLLMLIRPWARILTVAGVVLASAGAAQAQTPIRVEAENATLKGALSKLTDTPGYSGTGYVGNFENTTDTLLFSIPTQNSRYTLTIRYSAPTQQRQTSVLVNGDATLRMLPLTGNAFATADAGTYMLAAGTSKIAIAAYQGYYAIDYIELTPIITKIAPLTNGRVEAEDGLLSAGITVATALTGFSGTGYVTGFDNSDAKKVSISFNLPATGLYQLSVGYSSPYGFKVANVTVNDEKSTATFNTPTSGNFGSTDAGKFLLPQGLNTVEIGGNYGYYGIDYVQLTPTTVALPSKPSKQLIDAQATPSAKALMSYLVDLYGMKVLSGQADDQYGTSGSDISYVLATTGKEPAISAMDLYDYSAAPVAQYGQPNGTAERYLSWSKSGNGHGITSLIWHWRSPTDLKYPSDPSGAFYVSKTNFNLADVLADKTGTRYLALINDIDLIAVQLKKFQAAGVPVLWRPLHEAAGGWFWWGRDRNPVPFKELWHILYDRLTNYHQLHNLIWVYSITDNQDLSWYPGDNYVDITGPDVYGPDRTSSLSNYWSSQQTMFGGHKLVALTETGNPPDPDKIRGYATWWSWFASWSGKFVREQPVSYLKRLYNDQDILTKDELPDWARLATAAHAGAAATAAGFSIAPNPATGFTLNARLHLPAPQQVQVELFNSLGQRVASLHPQLLAGENQFQVPIAGLVPGVYQLLVRLAGQPPLSQRVLVSP